VTNILARPYMNGLSQYGVGNGTLRGAFIVTSPDPPNTFSDDNVHQLISDLIDQGTLPEPDDNGGQNLNCVFMPPGVIFNSSSTVGEHTYDTDYDFPGDYDKAWFAWVTNDGSLTNYNSIPRIFSHELVEACTD